jgi:hypothetical protein
LASHLENWLKKFSKKCVRAPEISFIDGGSFTSYVLKQHLD